MARRGNLKQDISEQNQTYYQPSQNFEDIYSSKTNRQEQPEKILLLMIIGVILVFGLTIFMNGGLTILSENNTQIDDTSQVVEITTTQLGSDNIGYAEKIGPYGNASSPIKIAYIVGVHPRESGAHRLMEEAINETASNLRYSYYIYRVNVTTNNTEFNESRTNGQILAKEYVVPDIINNTFNFAVDVHYSDGSWGVERFIFSPSNTSLGSTIGHAIADTYDWTVYFNPPNPTSPEYVTGPLENEGVPSLVYEAYSDDANSTTLDEDKALINFIDNWNFTNNNTSTTN